MLNGNKYINIIKQLLEKKFSGKASLQELQELDRYMQQDELLAEAFSNADLSVFVNAREIAASANEQINNVIKSNKPFGKQYIYYITTVLILIFFTWLIWPNKKIIHTKHDSSLTLPIKIEEKNVSPKHEYILPADEKPQQTEKNVNTQQKQIIEKNKHKEQLITEEISTKENISVTNSETDKQVNEEKPKESKQDLKSDNTANLVDYATLPTIVRVQHIQILSKINAAESENINRNNDVTNPNIGEPITKRKSNTSYNIDDMPYYFGNDAGFTGYLSRKLSGAVVLPRNKIPHSATVRFVVNSKGKVENSEVIGNIPPQLEHEILKVINQAPDWQPGKLSGKKGKLEYIIAIYFGY